MKSRLLLTFLIVMALFTIAAHVVPAHGRPSTPQVVIGDGTPASCQTADATSAFSNAVAAGGEISFSCGDGPVIFTVDTSVTDQEVTVNGDSLIILSGENLRQLFYVTGSGNLTLNDLILQDGEASQGGAIAIDPQASVTINRSFLISNEAAGDGGASTIEAL